MALNLVIMLLTLTLKLKIFNESTIISSINNIIKLKILKMKRFGKNLAVTLGLVLTSVFFAQSQEFTDLNVKQLGNNVNLEYSIVGEQIG